jgi:hypothetical protein
MKRNSNPGRKKVAKPGGKSQCTPEFIQKAYKMALLGLTNQELAVALDVAVQTIEKYLRYNYDFEYAINMARQKADAEVAASLYKKATGYTLPDTHILKNTKKFYDKKGNLVREEQEPVAVPITKHIGPDTKAIMFWLQNRTRNNDFPWMHTQNFEVGGKGGGPIVMDHTVEEKLKSLDVDELKKLEELSMKLTK